MEQRRTEALELLTSETHTFIETLHALRGLKEVTHPQAMTLDEDPRWTKAISRQASLIDATKQRSYLATMKAAWPFTISILNGGAHTFTNLSADKTLDWQPVDRFAIVPDEHRDELREQLSDVGNEIDGQPDFELQQASNGNYRVKIEDPEIYYYFWQAVEELEKGVATPTHSALLMRSILTMAVSAFEVFVSNVYRSFLLCNPGAADNSDSKTFSLSDLYGFGTVQDAIAESIFQQADSFSRKGVRAWTQWFKGKPLEVDLAGLAHDWGRTQEIFERRNVVVHNGSKTTRQYLHNVDSGLTENLTEGSPLDIEPDYVEEALERLITLGVLVGYKVRVRMFQKDNAAAISTWIQNEQFELLLKSHFNAVDKISESSGDAVLKDMDRNLLRVNGWIARMRLNGVETGRKEIEKWDTSALSDSFRAARNILLRRDEAAVSAIRELIKSDDLSIEDVREWPLFYWLREDGKLDGLFTEFEDSRTTPEPRMEIVTVDPDLDSTLPASSGAVDPDTDSTALPGDDAPGDTRSKD
ncbi:hypothetical protein [Nocardioides sp. AX2bis]|uniref:hypothetical protein n=1 Tax=Nocardioides sp. AX2bis TaxID=2653157 RepID=UPI0012F1D06A|nr:hypothetical protein [Nocardioides sp. AX2bis]VXB92910.1 hypothetical protein NOCARDAX2BIS_390034 [Nocardioides sp. AX2bis]